MRRLLRVARALAECCSACASLGTPHKGAGTDRHGDRSSRGEGRAVGVIDKAGSAACGPSVLADPGLAVRGVSDVGHHPRGVLGALVRQEREVR